MSTSYCGCNVCPNGLASSYNMTISGVSNNLCSLCAGYNTSWVMTQPPPGNTPCKFTAVTSICSLGSWILTFQNDTHGNLEAVLTLGTSSGLTWTQTNLPDAFQVMSLALSGSNTQCNGWPSTIVVTPVGPPFSDLVAASACIPSAALGTAPGSNLGIVQPPYLGGCPDPLGLSESQGAIPFGALGAMAVMPPVNAGAGCGCGCGGGATPGGCGCGCAGGGLMGGPVALPPTAAGQQNGGNASGGLPGGPQTHIAPFASSGCGCGCGCGTTILPVGLGIVLPVLTNVGPVQVNLSNGNLLLPLPPVAVGPFNPQPILFYNSLSPASSEFGFGWNNLFKQMLYFPKSLPWKTDS